MKAFEIKTTRSDYPFLVIASGFKEAVEILHRKGIHDTNIISVRQMEAYKDDHILHEWELTAREELKKEVRTELQKTMPRWHPEPDGAMGGSDRDVFLIRLARGHYFTSSCIGGDNYYLELETLEQLPGLPEEE